MYFQILRLMNREQACKMILACIFLIVAAGLSVLPFYFIYLIITDLSAASQNITGYFINIGYIMGTYVIAYVFLFLGYHISHILAYEVLYDVRINIADLMMRFPLGYFIDTRTGDLQVTMDENVEKLELFLAHHFPEMVALIIVPIALVILTFFINSIMGLLIALTLGTALLIVIYARRDFAPAMRMVLENQARMHAAILEHLQGLRIIRAFSLASSSSTRFRKEVERYQNFAVTWYRRVAPAFSIFQAIITSTLVVIVPAGGYLYLIGEISAPVFFFFLVSGTLFGRLLLRIYTILRYLNEEFECMERIGRIMSVPTLLEPAVGKEPDSFTVTCENVRFGYGASEVLQGISCTIREGTIAAIVGPSGAGKTTISRLIPRFYDPDEGRILIGGIDIREMRTSTLMSLISVVFQDVYLFQGTILENIRIGKPDASDEEVIAAGTAARCDAIIQNLQDGYQTMVGDRGVCLSGGERQRISIARAMLKNAPILILDEATAFVDPENELLIQEALTVLTRGKTVIVIAHRLNTIRDVDQIFFLDRGEFIEQGSFQELINGKGAFSQMWIRFEKTLMWHIGRE